MSFIVENGSALSNATSYASVEDLDGYYSSLGVDLSTESTITKEVWLNKATAHIDNKYCFKGDIVLETQALQFPRNYVYDKNNYSLSSESVPLQVKKATYELAMEVKTNPTLETEANISSKKIGPVTINYGANENGVVGNGGGSNKILNFLKSLLCDGQLNVFRT